MNMRVEERKKVVFLGLSVCVCVCVCVCACVCICKKNEKSTTAKNLIAPI